MKSLPRNSFTWLRAVNACEKISGKAQTLRLAIAIFLSADNKSGLTWASNENLADLAGLPDRSNFRKQRLALERVGAVVTGAIVDLPDDLRPKAFDPRGTYFKLDFDWAIRVVDLTTKAEEEGQNVVDLTSERGQSDHIARSISPQTVVDLTPLSHNLPDISHDLLRERARGMDIDDLIAEAIETKDDALLWYVSLKDLSPKLEALIGVSAYKRWFNRSMTWQQIIGGIGEKALQSKSA